MGRWLREVAVDRSKCLCPNGLEIDFLKRVLQRVEEARMLQALNGAAPSTARSTKKSGGKRR
jgi:hypothetical protein